jgi:hypothetical protein
MKIILFSHNSVSRCEYSCLKGSIFCDITQLKVNRRFGGTCHLVQQRGSMWQAELSRWFLLRLVFDSVDVPPKRRLTFSGLRSVI